MAHINLVLKLIAILLYSETETCVFRTPWDQPKVSWLSRCPDFPGQFICKWTITKCPDYEGVPIFKCPD